MLADVTVDTMQIDTDYLPSITFCYARPFCSFCHVAAHLDYDIMTKCVAQSAGCALGLLITKCKNIGGVPFDVFTR